MAEKKVKGGLSLVKGEIGATLRPVRELAALCSASGIPSDSADALAALEQVHGVLLAVQLPMPARLVNEMLQLTEQMSSGQVADLKESSATLSRSLIQLTEHLDQLDHGLEESPLSLRPIINEVRVARNEEPLGRSEILAFASFAANGGMEQPTPEELEAIAELMRKGRTQYLHFLLEWYRNESQRENLARLVRVFRHLHTHIKNRLFSDVFFLSEVFTKALYKGHLPTDADTRSLVGRLDKLMKPFLQKPPAWPQEEAFTMVDLLLQALDEAGTLPFEINTIRLRYGAPVAAASSAILELAQAAASALSGYPEIEEHLERFAESGRKEGDLIEVIRSSLENLSSILNVSGGEDLVARLGRVVDKLATLATMADADVGRQEEGIATELLSIKSLLNSYAQQDPSYVPMDVGGGLGLQELNAVTLREAGFELEHVKSAIADYHNDRNNLEALSPVPPSLITISGALRIIGEDAAGTLAETISVLLQGQYLDHSRTPTEAEFDHLADAIAGLELHITQLQDGQLYSANLIERANQSLETLRQIIEHPELAEAKKPEQPDSIPEPEPVAESAPVPPVEEKASDLSPESEFVIDLNLDSMPVSDFSIPLPEPESRPVAEEAADTGNEIDTEFLEIFLEEAQEEIVSATEQYGRWSSDLSDQEALTTLRRSFHTLKGSGRLVGLNRIADVAQASEFLLNRVIDKTIEVTPAIIEYIGDVVAKLPDLVAAEAENRPYDFKSLADRGDRLRTGEEVAPVSIPEPQSLEEVLTASAETRPVEPADSVTPTQDGVFADTAMEESVPTFDHLSLLEEDSELLDIFRAEAHEYLATLQDYVARSRSGLMSVEEPVLRALHTLTGSARMSGIDSIAAVVKAMEKRLRSLAEENLALDAAWHSLLERTLAGITARLDELPEVAEAAEALADLVTEITNFPDPQGDDVKAAGETGVSLSEEFSLPESFSLDESLPDSPSLGEELSGTPLSPDSGIPAEGEAAPAGETSVELPDTLELPVEFDESKTTLPDTLELPAEFEESKTAAESNFSLEEESVSVEDAHAELPDTLELPVGFDESKTTVDSGASAEEESAPVAVADAPIELPDTLELPAEFEEPATAVESSTSGAELPADEGMEIPEPLDVPVPEEEFAGTGMTLELEEVGIPSLEDAETVEESPETSAVLPEEPELPDSLSLDESGEEVALPGADEPELADAESVPPVLGEESPAEEEPFTIDLEIEPESVSEEETPKVLEEVAAEAVPAPDPEMVELFLEDARDLLDELDGHFTTWRESPRDLAALDGINRILHTLKGSARLTNLPVIGDLAHGLETRFRLLQDQPGLIGEDSLSLAQRSVDALASQVDAVEQGQPIPDMSELVAALSQTPEPVREVSPVAVESAAPEPVQATSVVPEPPAAGDDEAVAVEDSEVAALFLEDARDLLDSLDSQFTAWRQDPGDVSAIDGINRILHTLKGSARLSNLAVIGDLSHALETRLKTIHDHPETVPDDAALSLAQRAVDALASQVDALDRGGPVPRKSDLVQLLARESAEPPLSMTVPEQPESPVSPQPLAESPAPVDVDDAVSAPDPELAGLFLEDARDLLDNLESQFSAWQLAPHDITIIDGINRILHTLKGSARLTGIAVIGDVSHALETRLKSAHDQPDAITDTTIELAQRAVDGLAAQVEALELGNPIPKLKDLVAALSRDVADASESGEGAAPQVAVMQPAHDDAPTAPAPVPTKPAAPAAANERHGDAAASGGAQVRIKSELLNQMVDNAGEITIYRARLTQRNNQFGFSLGELEQTLQRLRTQLRSLEMETYKQLGTGRSQEGAPDREREDEGEFDQLELDQYSTLHQLSGSLAETVDDLASVKELLGQYQREVTDLLTQQARLADDLQYSLLRTRLVPFVQVVPRLHRLVRQTADSLSKSARLEVIRPEVALDRSILDRLVAPLEHLLRNAVDHGLETPEERERNGKSATGNITLALRREGNDAIISLADDGKGVDVDAIRKKAVARGQLAEDAEIPDDALLQFILEPGFTTRSKVTQISGRGVGMDVVASEIKAANGSIDLHSEPGRGSTFTIRLPLTLAMIEAFLVGVGDNIYAIPHNSIKAVARISREDLTSIYQGQDKGFHYLGQTFKVVYLGGVLDSNLEPNFADRRRLPLLLARVGDQRIALQVDSLIESQRIVVKPLGPQLAEVRWLSGGTILPDGRVALILDALALIRSEAVQGYRPAPRQVEATTSQICVMVVDDSLTVRRVTSRLLKRQNMEVITAKDGVEALTLLDERRPDVVLLDVEMPRMDGYELTRHIRRSEERLRDLPIIMITSRTGSKHRQHAMDLGVNRYLGKPYQEAQLLDEIRSVLAETAK